MHISASPHLCYHSILPPCSCPFGNCPIAFLSCPAIPCTRKQRTFPLLSCHSRQRTFPLLSCHSRHRLTESPHLTSNPCVGLRLYLKHFFLSSLQVLLLGAHQSLELLRANLRGLLILLVLFDLGACLLNARCTPLQFRLKIGPLAFQVSENVGGNLSL
jgi:hypothetical protein